MSTISLSAIENAIRGGAKETQIPAPDPAPSNPKPPGSGQKRGRGEEGSGSQGTQPRKSSRTDHASSSPPQPPQQTPEEEVKKRAELKRQITEYVDAFDYLEAPKGLDYDKAPIPTIELALHKIQAHVSNRNSLQMGRTMLLTASNSIETVGAYCNLGIEGFTADVSSEIGNFDDCLKELTIKYGGGSASPEVALAFGLLGVGFRRRKINQSK